MTITGRAMPPVDADPDGTSPCMGGRVSLRRILNHVIAEYARHADHADPRERIDGATGV